MTDKKMILELIPMIMHEVGSIGKNAKTGAGGGFNYAFRSIDEMYNRFMPLFSKHNVSIQPSLKNREMSHFVNSKGTPQTRTVVEMDFTLHAVDGSKLTFGPFAGEGVDSGDKSTSKAMTMCYKYFIIQTFCLAVADEQDPDKFRPELDEPKKSFSTASKLETVLERTKILGISETDIRNKFAVSSVDKLTEAQLTELVQCGRNIKEGKAKLRELFPLKNYAPGAS